MMRKFLFILGLIPNLIFTCSNIAIIGNGFAVTARTMDFPFNTGSVLGVGFTRESNETDLNLDGGRYQSRGVVWKNKYNFIGQTWFGSPLLLDGVNDAGLYAAFLYLPNFTQYPKVKFENGKKLLGISNLINFCLGVASNVDDALKQLEQYALVPNAIHTSIPSDPGLFVEVPIHFVLRDRSGNAAVIEWIKGKTVIHRNAGPVLTNAPPYDWQLKNAAEYNFVSSENTSEKVEGAYMEGSGFNGIPGSWTPPNRFARATQIIRNMPAPTDRTGALRNALSVIESVQVPLGTNPSPTLWKTLIDMKKSIYYFYPLYIVHPNYASLSVDKNATVAGVDPSKACERYDLKAIARSRKVPSGMVHAKMSKTSQKKIKRIENVIEVRTPGPKATKL